jgi:selenide,water dikinase
VRWPEDLEEPRRILLCDAQTSGGLLIAVPAGQTDALLSELDAQGAGGWLVGELLPGEAGLIAIA